MRERSVGKLSILPPLSLFTNCVIWSWYAHLIGDTTVLLPNLTGVAFGAVYTGVYLKYATTSQMKLLAASGATIAAVSAAALSFPSYQVLPYIGLTGDVLAVILMASPLATIRTVLAEKSTKAMPFPTSLVSPQRGPKLKQKCLRLKGCSIKTQTNSFAHLLPLSLLPQHTHILTYTHARLHTHTKHTCQATFFNGACWTTYGSIVMGDPLIWVPNALGFLAASVQMVMFLRFGIYRPPKDSAATSTKA